MYCLFLQESSLMFIELLVLRDRSYWPKTKFYSVQFYGIYVLRFGELCLLPFLVVSFNIFDVLSSA